jgi:DNA-binding SARP family transcriptional activator
MVMDFGLLGAVRAREGGADVDVGHTRQRSVLAALLVDVNHLVTTDQLVDRVWGDRPPGTANGTLRSYLTRLRQAVARDGVSIDRRPGGYVLAADPDSVDLHRFTRLVEHARRTADDRVALDLLDRALALWRGDPLAGLDLPWANALRTALRRERLAAELDRADVQLRLGNHAALLATLPTLAAEHPLDERLAGQLILARYRAGRLDEALDHYRGFRARLSDELGADPAPALQELHRKILAVDEEVQPPAATVPRGTVPRQLPARPRSFTGRGGELKALTLRSDGQDQGFGTVVISAIGGGGGIGKTWLALHWAHEHLDRFPDGQLYVNLRGFDPTATPVDPATALRGFLGALGVAPDAVPADPAEREAQFRSAIAGKRMLVLLDNASGTNQVMPLLPGSATCTTLVTSRHPLTGLVALHGALSVPLDVLTEDEARELLLRQLGHQRIAAEPDAVAELVAHCAGLPLALGIVAAHAAVRPALRLSTMASELRDHTSRLDGLDTGEAGLSLRAVLSWSYHALTAEAVTLVGLISLAPGADISLPAVTALSPTTAAHTRALLRELEAAHLVAHSDGRYRMHDLVRLYAGERATAELCEETRSAATRRVVDFHLHTAHAADRVLDPDRPPIGIGKCAAGVRISAVRDEFEAVEWLATEHATLVACQRLAADLGWHDHVWGLTAVLDTFHWRQGRVDDHIAMGEAAVAAVRAIGDHARTTRAHRNLGQTYARAGRQDESLEQLGLALDMAVLIGDRAAQGHAHLVLARAWSAGGEHSRALAHATSAITVYREIGDSAEGSAVNQAAMICAELGDFTAGIAYGKTALALEEANHHLIGRADALDTLGYLSARAGLHAEAVAHYEQAVVLYHEEGHTSGEADTLVLLGRAHVELGDLDGARRTWGLALRLFESQQRTAEVDRVQEHLLSLPRP